VFVVQCHTQPSDIVVEWFPWLTCALPPDVQTNVGIVDAHVADYQRMIDNLQVGLL
jgi:hypothetical protein